MKRLSRRLKKKRQLLLKRYDPDDLHALRVTLRRMRSRLKPVPGKKARQLRHDLGLLADATNGARDWDTLLANARHLLSTDQFEQLAPWLEERQSSAHDQVMHMLHSAGWFATVKRWKHHEQEHRQLREKADGGSEQDLSRTLQKLVAARYMALSHNDDKRWHKLRIAFKDLRYQLDAAPKNARSARDREILDLCKELQVDLGEWHDTVVHGQLLREIAFTRDSARHAPAFGSLERLRKAIEDRGRIHIEQVRSRLEQPQVSSVLSPSAEGV